MAAQYIPTAEHMAGLDYTHPVAQAWEAGKLSHIDLSSQAFGRHDQDFRFAAVKLKCAVSLVSPLEDVSCQGSRHFDAYAYRNEDCEGAKEFVRSCIRSYLILKEKAAQWNADPEIHALVAEINADDGSTDAFKGACKLQKVNRMKSTHFDHTVLGARAFECEQLDQLNMKLQLGVR